MATKKKQESIDVQIENILEVDFDNQLLSETFSNKVYAGLSKVEGLDEYLRLTILTDLKKYYMAVTDKERDQVRGHIALANAIKKRIIEARR